MQQVQIMHAYLSDVIQNKDRKARAFNSKETTVNRHILTPYGVSFEWLCRL